MASSVQAVHSRGAGSGTLFVVVTDFASRPVAGASISVTSKTGMGLTGTTGTNGTWGFAVPAGGYDVFVKKQGFRDFTIHKEVADTVNVTVPVQLAADPGGPVGGGFYVFAGVLGAVVAIGVAATVVKRRRAAAAGAERKEAEKGPKAAADKLKAVESRSEETSPKARKIDVVGDPGGGKK
jgi:hypothetical protein